MASLYVHIPFCEKKCAYCDFFSVASRTGMGEFLAALGREIDLAAPAGEGRSFESVFFGGGTPSLLAPAAVAEILGRLRKAFDIIPGAEITLEANPGAVAAGNLDGYHAAGVNRLSIGVQSFEDGELRFLGRIHSAAEARAVVRSAREAGFDNISLDLMYGLPGQGPAAWRRTLEEALALDTEHLSAYNLIVEEATPLARMVRRGAVVPNPPEWDAELYALTMQVLADGGFEQYEISNYARPGRRCRHNMAYWTHEPYLGFGPSAHSFWRDAAAPYGRRWWNRADLTGYAHALGHGVFPRGGEETLGRRDALVERMLLGLRSGGVDLCRLRGEFGWSPDDGSGGPVEKLLAASLATLGRGVLRLTRRGYLLCDEITARLVPASP